MKKVILSVSAMLFVGAMSFAQSNMSSVNQVGVSETAIVNQNGMANQSDVSQLGVSNKSEVYQGINPESYDAKRNSATVMQEGNSNSGFISQSNRDNEAFQTQNGTRNSATIWQDQVAGGDAALRGSDKATQTQTGRNNIATVDQGTSGNERPVAPSPFTDAQLAAAAGVPVPVSPNFDNEATQTQNGGGNTAYASQGGVKNASVQTQMSPEGTSLAAGNVSNHYQYGRHNSAITNQDGTKLLDDTMQIGNRNTATITQNGMGHESVAYSNGTGNSITVTQNNGM